MGYTQLLRLLYFSVAAILIILGLTVSYALNASKGARGAAAGAEGIELRAGGGGAETSGDYRKGKTLWNANACGSCHAKDMKTDATGPALAGVTERWAAYPREDLYAWVRNNGQLAASGHARAAELVRSYEATMPLYTNLTDEEVEALLAYIEGRYVSTVPG